MSEEIAAAAKWWASRLSGMPHESMVTDFELALVKELSAHYEGHWHADDPTRGSGFRAISCDRFADAVLVRAGRAAGIMRLDRYLASAEKHVMFVNPGSVRVRNLSYYHAPTVSVYEAPGEVAADAKAAEAAGEAPEAKSDEAEHKEEGKAQHAGGDEQQQQPPPQQRSPVYGPSPKGAVTMLGSAEGLSVGA